MYKNMHILIIPSERYMPEDNSCQGIFQHHQAQALKAAGYKIGILAPPELVSRSSLFRTGAYKIFEEPVAARNRGIPVLKCYVWYVVARIPRFGMWLWFNSWERLFKRYLAMYGLPDIIHAHNARFAGVLASRIKRRWHVPYVLTEHSSTYARDPLTKFEALVIKEAFNRTDRRLVVSPKLGYLLERIVGKDIVYPWECVPNVLGPIFEKNAFFKYAQKHKQTSFRFLNIGSLIKIKGQEELLHAFADRFKGLDEVQLRIGGAGHLENELKCMANKLGIEKQVKFLGMLTREEVLAQMQACDVYAHSSHYETFGVVIIEALSCGKPVVSTACGGPESILNKENGILVPTYDIRALGEAMVSIKDRMADYDPVKIREDCIARFGSSAITTRLLRIYREVYPKTAVNYTVCNRCVMDTTDPEIEFDDNGVCNHCHHYDEIVKNNVFSGDSGIKKLTNIIEKIKEEGKHKQYDCVIGVSGGVDSSYAAFKVKEFGLRPLAIHLDNGWNSELAVSNIRVVLKKLDIDLYTHVADWEEFKDLQVSFLKASTPDSEIPTDHAILAFMYQMAKKIGVGYVISGLNARTESHKPDAWSQGYFDWGYISGIHRRFGKHKLKKFTHMNLWALRNYLRNIKWINILNYIDYKKASAIQILEQEIDWKDYGSKHHESIYTRFYQGYILPQKFGYDKRRSHLSSLVCSGEITRHEALEELKNEPYSAKLQEEDRLYVIKKLGLTDEEFEKIMRLPKKSYWDYPSYGRFYKSLIFRRYRKIRDFLNYDKYIKKEPLNNVA